MHDYPVAITGGPAIERCAQRALCHQAECICATLGGRHLVGKCLVDVHARGGFQAWRDGVEVGCVAGRMPFGVGRLLGPFPEPNDGTVAVDETRIAGLADHIVLPVSHVALLWSTSVAAQVAHFLEQGRFRHEAK